MIRAYAIIDGERYELTVENGRIVNTSGRTIPIGATMYTETAMPSRMAFARDCMSAFGSRAAEADLRAYRERQGME